MNLGDYSTLFDVIKAAKQKMLLCEYVDVNIDIIIVFIIIIVLGVNYP